MATRFAQAQDVPTLSHAQAARACATAIRSMGLGVERRVEQRDGFDFLIEGSIRVAVRHAFPTTYREQHYRKKNGEVSRYLYKRWTFNFHRHGRIDSRYCDFFVCLLGSLEAAAGEDVVVFVIPWEAITGLTFCSSVRKHSARAYRGRYARYIDGWDAIVDAAATPVHHPEGGTIERVGRIERSSPGARAGEHVVPVPHVPRIRVEAGELRVSPPPAT